MPNEDLVESLALAMFNAASVSQETVATFPWFRDLARFAIGAMPQAEAGTVSQGESDIEWAMDRLRTLATTAASVDEQCRACETIIRCVRIVAYGDSREC